MNKLKVLDLFSGIGGFSLGLESTGGFETTAFCEIDKKAQLVLKKYWPQVPIYKDITTLKGENLGHIDIICGGFPCQDISTAGKGAGLAGKRSGLWFEFHRLIDEIKPAFALIENVSALRSKGLDEVLRSLSAIGYDAEWHCIPASSLGAAHSRDRVWIVAYPQLHGCTSSSLPCGTGAPIQHNTERQNETSKSAGSGTPRLLAKESPRLTALCTGSTKWPPEPAVGRVAHGVPYRMDRIRQLGNAVVPLIPALLGNAILSTFTDTTKDF